MNLFLFSQIFILVYALRSLFVGKRKVNVEESEIREKKSALSLPRLLCCSFQM